MDRAALEWRENLLLNVLPATLRWAAYLLRTAAVGLLALAVWRFGNDLGATQPFFIEDGTWSHWQPWLALAIACGLCPGFLRRIVPEKRVAIVAQMLPGAHELFDHVQPMPPSIPPSIETPCSVEVRRAMGY